jgi:hypothetical protein
VDDPQLVAPGDCAQGRGKGGRRVRFGQGPAVGDHVKELTAGAPFQDEKGGPRVLAPVEQSDDTVARAQGQRLGLGARLGRGGGGGEGGPGNDLDGDGAAVFPARAGKDGAEGA